MVTNDLHKAEKMFPKIISSFLLFSLGLQHLGAAVAQWLEKRVRSPGTVGRSVMIVGLTVGQFLHH